MKNAQVLEFKQVYPSCNPRQTATPDAVDVSRQSQTFIPLIPLTQPAPPQPRAHSPCYTPGKCKSPHNPPRPSPRPRSAPAPRPNTLPPHHGKSPFPPEIPSRPPSRSLSRRKNVTQNRPPVTTSVPPHRQRIPNPQCTPSSTLPGAPP